MNKRQGPHRKQRHPLAPFSFVGIGLFLTTLLLISSGCSTPFGNKTPEWVVNPKAVYPENKFLVAVGEGDTRRSAENAAAANLSRIFEAHIESDERMSDQSHETNSSIMRTTDFSADINILSSQTLYNIQHAEAWKDKLARYHAVAYLNRRDTAGIYRDKIYERTTRVNFLLSSARNTQDVLKKYATLRAAAKYASEADLLLRQLKTIHPPSIADASPSYSNNKIRKELADTAKQIQVQINVSGDTDQRMTQTLEQLITGYGFIIGKPASLNLTGRVSVNDTGEREQDLVFVRYELAVQIKDSNHSTLVSFGNKGREAHKTIEQARIRSFRTLDQIIKATGSHRLDTYFDALVDQLPNP